MYFPCPISYCTQESHLQTTYQLLDKSLHILDFHFGKLQLFFWELSWTACMYFEFFCFSYSHRSIVNMWKVVVEQTEKEFFPISQIIFIFLFNMFNGQAHMCLSTQYYFIRKFDPTQGLGTHDHFSRV